MFNFFDRRNYEQLQQGKVDVLEQNHIKLRLDNLEKSLNALEGKLLKPGEWRTVIGPNSVQEEKSGKDVDWQHTVVVANKVGIYGISMEEKTKSQADNHFSGSDGFFPVLPSKADKPLPPIMGHGASDIHALYDPFVEYGDPENPERSLDASILRSHLAAKRERYYTQGRSLPLVLEGIKNTGTEKGAEWVRAQDLFEHLKKYGIRERYRALCGELNDTDLELKLTHVLIRAKKEGLAESKGGYKKKLWKLTDGGKNYLKNKGE
ncbi:MAG TPA: hypothetical protein VHA52_09820 [Candidatus Babeliaceae bacterium]|nr:hypothetical protein [Candidatus Babeliaceae bacterium]